MPWSSLLHSSTPRVNPPSSVSYPHSHTSSHSTTIWACSSPSPSSYTPHTTDLAYSTTTSVSTSGTTVIGSVSPSEFKTFHSIFVNFGSFTPGTPSTRLVCRSLIGTCRISPRCLRISFKMSICCRMSCPALTTNCLFCLAFHWFFTSVSLLLSWLLLIVGVKFVTSTADGQ